MLYTCTFNRKSVGLRYGSLKGFLDNFPADGLRTFKQSKNLSKISQNREVSSALPFNVRAIALDTELLSTWQKQYKQNHLLKGHCFMHAHVHVHCTQDIVVDVHIIIVHILSTKLITVLTCAARSTLILE